MPEFANSSYFCLQRLCLARRIQQDGCIQYQRPSGSAVVGRDTFTHLMQKLPEHCKHASLVALFVSRRAAGAV